MSRIIFISYLTIFSALAETPNSSIAERSSKDISTWDYLTGGFRKTHSFSLLPSMTSSKWEIGEVSESLVASGYNLSLRFSYHIPLYRSLGYFLGSSLAYGVESFKRNVSEVGSYVQIPGVAGGFVYNFNAKWRTLVGADYFLERWNGVDVGEKVHVTAQCIDLFTSTDRYYDLKWAMRLTFHQKKCEYKGAKDSVGFKVGTNIVRRTMSFGFGLNHHFL